MGKSRRRRPYSRYKPYEPNVHRQVKDGFCCVCQSPIRTGEPYVALPAKWPKRNPGLAHPGKCHNEAMRRQNGETS